MAAHQVGDDPGDATVTNRGAVPTGDTAVAEPTPDSTAPPPRIPPPPVATSPATAAASSPATAAAASTPATAVPEPRAAVVDAARSGVPGAGVAVGSADAVAGGGARRPGWRRRSVALVGGVVAVVLLVGAGAAYAYAGDVARGVTVLGVELGGLSRDEAQRRLRDGTAQRAAAPFTVRVGDRRVQVSPDEVLAQLDVSGTVAAATAVGRAPWAAKTVQPVIRVDAERLAAVLRAGIGPAAVAMTRPAITYAGLTPRPVYPKPGRGIDAQRAADAVRSGWLRVDEVPVPLAETQPATTRAEVDRLLTELATPAVSGPVTVTTEAGAFTLAPAVIAKSLLLTADATGRITPRIDAAKLRAAAGRELAKVEVKPQEARISVAGGAPKVVASTGGTVVDLARLGGDLLAVLPRTGQRQVTAQLVAQPAATTEAEMSKLGVKERVSTFTTDFDGGRSEPRTRNIVLAAKKVDGALVKPGETFSLNGYTGPRGYPEGYVDAPVISGGKLVPAVGGGISQFATTLFNAAYYAGLQDVDHTPHSYWFSRYPPVIEATIFYPTLDLKFRNDTPYGVLIDTSTNDTSVTVSLWSTKVYDSVKTEWGPKRDFTSPETVRLPAGPSCIATQGIDGFAQDAWRIVRQGGKEIRRQKFSWRYDAEPRFICDANPS